MTGLAIIDKNEKYTNVAQGIFRMRKLNKGQIVDIAYNGELNEGNTSSSISNEQFKINIWKNLKENDFKFKEFKKPYQKLQNLKFLIRNTNNNNNYIQNEMKPLFIRKLENKNVDILKIFDVQINWDDKLNNGLIQKLRDELKKNSISLENILFSGFVQEQEQEQFSQTDKSKDYIYNKELSSKINRGDIYYNYYDSLFDFLFFPDNNDNDIHKSLLESYGIIEENDEFSLFLTTNFFSKIFLDSEFYFIEFAQNSILLMIDYDIRNHLENSKKGNFKDIMLYLRDFPVYNSLGICINNKYHNFGKKENLFNRYGNKIIFSILRKIINNKILLDKDLLHLEKNYNKKFIFNLFLYIHFGIKTSDELYIQVDDDDLNDLNEKFNKLEEKDFKKLDKIDQEKIINIFSRFDKFDEYINLFIKQIIFNKENYNRYIFNIKEKIMDLYGEADKYSVHINNYYNENYNNQKKIINRKIKRFKEYILRVLAKYNKLDFIYIDDNIESVND